MKASTIWIVFLAGAVLAPAQEPLNADVIPDADAGRVLGVIPDNKIVSAQQGTNGEPLTARGKFTLAFRDSIDPFTFVAAGFYGGIAQWENDYPTFGQGASGFGKRYGAAYADQVIGNFFTEAILPSLTHEDPRYFRKGGGGGWARMGYALTRTLITRTDRGRHTFNVSEIAGNSIAAGLSNLYYPADQRNVSETVEKFGIQVLGDTAFNVLIEFWPDMRHMIFKH